MSYCVHCGVELDEQAKRCPRCGTPVVDPSALEPMQEAPFFASRREEVPPVSKTELALLLTGMLASVTICCSVVNLFVGRTVAWSLYVTGAAAMLWFWCVLPLLARHMPVWVRLTLDVGAIGLYVYLISLALQGSWFMTLALPILILAALLVLVLGLALQGRRRSLLTAASLDILAFGVFMLGVEYFWDRYFRGQWELGWSMVIFLACVALVIPLVIMRLVPSLREEARRRFHR